MRHHFIPAAIIGAWSTDEAWELVRPDVRSTARTARGSSQTARRGIVCVQTKQRTAREFIARPAEDVFYVNGMYSIPTFGTAIERGLAAWVLQMNQLARIAPDPKSIDEILEWFSPQYDTLSRDLVERALARDVDGPFVSLTNQLRRGFKHPDRHLIRDFMVGQFIRSPVWINSSECRATVEQAIAATRSAHQPSAAGLGGSQLANAFDRVLRVLMTLIVIARHRTSSVVEWGRVRWQVDILTAPDGTQFILGDNPCHPFVPHDRNSWDGPRPGIANRDAQICLPVGPRTCLVLRTIASSGAFGGYVRRRTATSDEVLTINEAQLVFAAKEIVYPGIHRSRYLPEGCVPQAVNPRTRL